MTGNDSRLMDNSEILAVSKILLESRAFSKREITSILDKLVLGCVPRKNMKLVSDLIAMENIIMWNSAISPIIRKNCGGLVRRSGSIIFWNLLITGRRIKEIR